MRTLPILALTTLMGFAVIPAAAQNNPVDTRPGRAEQTETAKQGVPLKTALTVKGNVTVQAVLIPFDVGKRVFGREIAKKYAIVQVTINNKSADAALIVQGAFLDYHDWALAGLAITPPGSAPTCVEGTDEEIAGDPHQSQYQACTKGAQVASEDARIARGQLLDAQPWTWRNLLMNSLSLTGAVASAYSFSLKEKGIIKGIAAFNGNVIPGLGILLPDPTVGQLNRISDFGYQTNKVIPKQGSDIIVCFFPIDRFLTPGFKTIFLKEPALFLSPYELLVDKNSRERIRSWRWFIHFSVNPQSMVSTITTKKLDELAKALPCYLRVVQAEQTAQQHAYHVNPNADPKTVMAEMLAARQKTEGACGINEELVLALDTLGAVSLNTVRIVIDGVMTVETGAVPSTIQSIEFDDGNHNPEIWTVPGEKKGTIKGAYLTDGVPQIKEAQDLGLSDVKAIPEGSTDKALRFSFKLTKPITSGKTLTFSVQKKSKDSDKPVTSMEFLFPVSYMFPPPEISNIEYKDKKITVTGKNFFGNEENKISVHLKNGGQDVSVTPTKQTPEELDFDAPDELKSPGCWTVVVSIGMMTAAPGKNSFAVEPAPSIASAKVSGNSVEVQGDGFVDTSSCGGSSITFQLVEDKTGATPVSTKIMKASDKNPTLQLPEEAKKGSWKVQVLLGKEVKSSAALK